jgi:hypothetical protein
LHTQPDVFNFLHKAVILSEAPRRSIAYRRALWLGVEEPILSVAEGTPAMLVARCYSELSGTNYKEN